MIIGAAPFIHCLHTAPLVGPVTRLRPDETFYSWVSRIAAAMGGLDVWAVRQLLFAGEMARFYPDLATGLRAFVSSSGQTRMSVEDLAAATTTYGYFARFKGHDSRRRLVDEMATVWVVPHHGTGLAHGTYEVRTLRFCPACHVIMDQMGGGRWWRRSHQLPTTLRCPDHDLALQASTIDCLVVRQGFFLPTPENCPETAERIGETEDHRARQLLGAMARIGRDCLEAADYRSPSEWALHYQQVVQAGRKTSASGHGLLEETFQFLRSRLGDFAAAGFIPFVDLGSKSWLHRLLLGSGPASPMEHVLLQASIETFFGSAPRATDWQFDPDQQAFLASVGDILQRRAVRPLSP